MGVLENVFFPSFWETFQMVEGTVVWVICRYRPRRVAFSRRRQFSNPDYWKEEMEVFQFPYQIATKEGIWWICAEKGIPWPPMKWTDFMMGGKNWLWINKREGKKEIKISRDVTIKKLVFAVSLVNVQLWESGTRFTLYYSHLFGAHLIEHGIYRGKNVRQFVSESERRCIKAKPKPRRWREIKRTTAQREEIWTEFPCASAKKRWNKFWNQGGESRGNWRDGLGVFADNIVSHTVVIRENRTSKIRIGTIKERKQQRCINLTTHLRLLWAIFPQSGWNEGLGYRCKKGGIKVQWRGFLSEVRTKQELKKCDFNIESRWSPLMARRRETIQWSVQLQLGAVRARRGMLFPLIHRLYLHTTVVTGYHTWARGKENVEN